MTNPMLTMQVIMEFVRNEPAEPEVMERVAEGCLAALNRDARFVAFGPVVSVDFERSAVEVECTVCGDAETEIEQKIDRIREIVQAGIAASEYVSSEERVAAAV